MFLKKKTVYTQEYGCWWDNWDSVGKNVFLFTITPFGLYSGRLKQKSWQNFYGQMVEGTWFEGLCWRSTALRDLPWGHLCPVPGEGAIAISGAFQVLRQPCSLLSYLPCSTPHSPWGRTATSSLSILSSWSYALQSSCGSWGSGQPSMSDFL